MLPAASGASAGDRKPARLWAPAAEQWGSPGGGAEPLALLQLPGWWSFWTVPRVAQATVVPTVKEVQ